jgi:hypothetical protein
MIVWDQNMALVKRQEMSIFGEFQTVLLYPQRPSKNEDMNSKREQKVRGK